MQTNVFIYLSYKFGKAYLPLGLRNSVVYSLDPISAGISTGLDNQGMRRTISITPSSISGVLATKNAACAPQVSTAIRNNKARHRNITWLTLPPNEIIVARLLDPTL